MKETLFKLFVIITMLANATLSALAYKHAKEATLQAIDASVYAKRADDHAMEANDTAWQVGQSVKELEIPASRSCEPVYYCPKFNK